MSKFSKTTKQMTQNEPYMNIPQNFVVTLICRNEKKSKWISPKAVQNNTWTVSNKL